MTRLASATNSSIDIDHCPPPVRFRTDTVPDATSLSPTTSMYGILLDDDADEPLD
jgi:hypothetical protein